MWCLLGINISSFSYIQFDGRKLTEYEYNVEKLDHWPWSKSFILMNCLNGGISDEVFRIIRELYRGVWARFGYINIINNDSVQLINIGREDYLDGIYLLQNIYDVEPWKLDEEGMMEWLTIRSETIKTFKEVDKIIRLEKERESQAIIKSQEEMESIMKKDLHLVIDILTLCTLYEETIEDIKKKNVHLDWHQAEYQLINRSTDYDLKKDLKFVLDLLSFNLLNELDRSLIVVSPGPFASTSHLMFGGRYSRGVPNSVLS
jgi:hypothetical protein